MVNSYSLLRLRLEGNFPFINVASTCGVVGKTLSSLLLPHGPISISHIVQLHEHVISIVVLIMLV